MQVGLMACGEMQRRSTSSKRAQVHAGLACTTDHRCSEAGRTGRGGYCLLAVGQQTCSEGAAVAEAGAAAAGVEEMAVTKEGMACASSSLGLHAPGPVPCLDHIA